MLKKFAATVITAAALAVGVSGVAHAGVPTPDEIFADGDAQSGAAVMPEKEVVTSTPGGTVIVTANTTPQTYTASSAQPRAAVAKALWANNSRAAAADIEGDARPAGDITVVSAVGTSSKLTIKVAFAAKSSKARTLKVRVAGTTLTKKVGKGKLVTVVVPRQQARTNVNSIVVDAISFEKKLKVKDKLVGSYFFL